VVVDAPAVGSDEVTRVLQDYVKGRLLPYKYPRIVTYLEELPKTGSGKIDRQALLRSVE
jgi:acetyl-CoA synthetase